VISLQAYSTANEFPTSVCVETLQRYAGGQIGVDGESTQACMTIGKSTQSMSA
jgi:hypothetical protein